MSNLQDFNTKLEAIEALTSDEVKQPNIPVDRFLQEGENLYHWCKQDKDALVAAGLNWALAEDLPVCLGALREAQSRWNAERHSQEEAGIEWAAKAPGSYDLRDSMVHTFRYAFRDKDDLLGRISVIADGDGHADMIQDLNDLAVLGRENINKLETIHYDSTVLDTAATLADELAALLAVVNGDRQEHSETKTLRDKAYTLCRNSIDEIRACGKYVFWRQPDRLKGYASEYYRRQNKKNTAANESGLS